SLTRSPCAVSAVTLTSHRGGRPAGSISTGVISSGESSHRRPALRAAAAEASARDTQRDRAGSQRPPDHVPGYRRPLEQKVLEVIVVDREAAKMRPALGSGRCRKIHRISVAMGTFLDGLGVGGTLLPLIRQVVTAMEAFAAPVHAPDFKSGVRL